MTPSGQQVCGLRLATSEKWKDNKTGDMKEATEWHRVVLWSKQAELAGKYLHKGSRVYVEGKLQTRTWDDQQGVKRYTTEIQASTVQFLDSKSDADRLYEQQDASSQPPVKNGFNADGSSAAYDDVPF